MLQFFTNITSIQLNFIHKEKLDNKTTLLIIIILNPSWYTALNKKKTVLKETTNNLFETLNNLIQRGRISFYLRFFLSTMSVCLPEKKEKLLHINLETENRPLIRYQRWMQWHRKGFEDQCIKQKKPWVTPERHWS